MHTAWRALLGGKTSVLIGACDLHVVAVSPVFRAVPPPRPPPRLLTSSTAERVRRTISTKRSTNRTTMGCMLSRTRLPREVAWRARARSVEHPDFRHQPDTAPRGEMAPVSLSSWGVCAWLRLWDATHRFECVNQRSAKAPKVIAGHLIQPPPYPIPCSVLSHHYYSTDPTLVGHCCVLLCALLCIAVGCYMFCNDVFSGCRCRGLLGCGGLRG